MFDNIGQKIKRIAKIQSLLFSLFYIIIGIIFISMEQFGSLGLIMFFIGLFGIPIFAFLLYGFGELIDKISEISVNIRNSVDNGYIIKDTNDSRLDKVCNFIYYEKFKIIIFLSMLVILIVAVTFVYFSFIIDVIR